MRWCVFLVCVAVAACGEERAGGDAGDLPPDSAEMCGASAVLFSGELLDWDSSAPIAGATLTVTAGGASATTTASGRWQLCLANDTVVLVDLVAGEYIGGTIAVFKDVLGANGAFSLRSFTAARGQQPPFAYDAAKAQVFVHVIGGARPVDVSSAHDAGFHFTGSAWVAGQTGTDVYVPNIDPTGGVAKVAVDSATEIGTVPIAAGAFTYVVAAAL